jgi:hypothetical protein
MSAKRTAPEVLPVPDFAPGLGPRETKALSGMLVALDAQLAGVQAQLVGLQSSVAAMRAVVAGACTLVEPATEPEAPRRNGKAESFDDPDAPLTIR